MTTAKTKIEPQGQVVAKPIPVAELSGRVASMLRHFARDDRVLIIITADPDSIASAVALKRLLWRRVAQITVASTNQVRRPDNLRLLGALKLRMPLVSDIKMAEYNKLALVDSQPQHTPQTAGLKFSLVIDHHPLLAQLPESQEYSDVRPDFGATATIMVAYLRAAKIKPNRVLATALFYAIKTDTQNFVRQGQLEDMRAFRWLYPLVHLPLLSEIERAPIDRSAFRVMVRSLSQAVFSKQYAYAFIEKLDHADTLVLIADFLMQINGVNRAAVSGVYKDKLVVVLRSAGLRSNVGQVAEKAFAQYGSAGGHKNMARAEMLLASLEPRLQGNPALLSRFVVRRLTEVLGSRKPIPEPAV